MGRRILSLLLALTAGVGLAACGQTQSPAEGQEAAAPEAQNSALLIAYAPETEGDPVAQATTLLAETLGGDVVEMGQEGDLTPSDYEFVLLGFAATDNALPAAVETFLDTYDFGARTLYPFVLGTGTTRLPSSPLSPSTSPGPCWGAGPPLHPRDGGGGHHPVGPVPAPARWGPCPGRGYGKHRGHRPGDAPRPAGPLPLGQEGNAPRPSRSTPSTTAATRMTRTSGPT